jgi:3-isopropylmalate/(R)-2-methylmalate dehydratase large subunit
MTICCGDSHTSTHGAFGAIAFGIGTSQVRDVLASQSLTISKLKVRRIRIEGELNRGVYAKDVILKIIQRTGAKGGVGYAHEYAGSLIEAMSMDERMTICNMAVEGGARCGYINPDDTTYSYLEGRRFAPKGAAWERALNYWQSVCSDKSAKFDDEIVVQASDISPMVTWGISLDQSLAIDERIPDPAQAPADERRGYEEALTYMDLRPGQTIEGYPVDVAFLGSCTNGRFSDFELVAKLLKESGKRVNSRVKALAVPGSAEIKRQLESSGVAQILSDAGFEVREAGCSMCLAMNPDKLEGRQVCASSSNRNFKGRQGSPVGRTLIMSPASVLAAAVEGAVADPRRLFSI